MAEQTNQNEPKIDPNQQVGVGDLNINDMVLLKSMIELGSQRGAWRANELSVVGTVYEKLTKFVASLMPATTETPAPAPAPTPAPQQPVAEQPKGEKPNA
jgi:hypothetical protein|tara:strand:- start:1158 stop:1457 length:300 start_codon:yes stop_codon:yes gene_type:complete